MDNDKRSPSTRPCCAWLARESRKTFYDFIFLISPLDQEPIKLHVRPVPAASECKIKSPTGCFIFCFESIYIYSTSKMDGSTDGPELSPCLRKQTTNLHREKTDGAGHKGPKAWTISSRSIAGTGAKGAPDQHILFLYIAVPRLWHCSLSDECGARFGSAFGAGKRHGTSPRLKLAKYNIDIGREIAVQLKSIPARHRQQQNSQKGRRRALSSRTRFEEEQDEADPSWPRLGNVRCYCCCVATEDSTQNGDRRYGSQLGRVYFRCFWKRTFQFKFYLGEPREKLSMRCVWRHCNGWTNMLCTYLA